MKKIIALICLIFISVTGGVLIAAILGIIPADTLPAIVLKVILPVILGAGTVVGVVAILSGGGGN